jgi:hypothetical protein
MVKLFMPSVPHHMASGAANSRSDDLAGMLLRTALNTPAMIEREKKCHQNGRYTRYTRYTRYKSKQCYSVAGVAAFFKDQKMLRSA